MTFGEKLRRARSHLLTVIIMIVTAAIVVTIEDDNLANEAGKPRPDHLERLPETS